MLWERQPDESSRAYRAFCVYRDAGSERSLQKVSRKIAKSLPLIKRWSRRHGWVERVRAFEEHEEGIRRESREAARREAASDLARRENDLRVRVFKNEERAVRLESEMIGRFEKMVEQLPLVEVEEIMEKDGVPVRCIFKPAVPDISLTIKRLHEISTRSVPIRFTSEEARPRIQTDEDRRRIEALRGDPEIDRLFTKLFPHNPGKEGGYEDDAAVG